MTLEQVGKVKAEAKGRQKAAGVRGKEGGRGKKKTLSQKIDEGFDPNKKRSDATLAKAAGRGRPKKVTQKIGEPIERHSGESTATLAKAAGTNRRYLEMAGDLLDEAPELAAKTKKGYATNYGS